jgi:hypothetical protein
MLCFLLVRRRKTKKKKKTREMAEGLFPRAVGHAHLDSCAVWDFYGN